MSICLNMIVKNEAKNLPRLFASLKDVVSSYVISDTGSTDNTIELIHELGKKYNIPGTIIENEWVDFAHNRNIALNKAYELVDAGVIQAKWLLIIDADEELLINDSEKFKELNPVITYHIHKILKEISHSTIALISVNQPKWEWKGSIHNHLFNKSNNHVGITTACTIQSHYFEGAKSHLFTSQKEKSKHDAALLEIEIAENNTSDPMRYFIQGNEYIEFNDNEKALIAYKTCLEKTKKQDLSYFTLIQIGVIYAFKLTNKDIGHHYFKQALETYPQRKEAYYYLGKMAQISKNFDEAKKYYLLGKQITGIPYNDFLFDLSIYQWKIDIDLILVYNQLNEKKTCLELINELQQKNHIPERNMALINFLKEKLLKG
jgi:glycosyltransferase involved in cell wall biosynthesis